nr:hypothetical protein [Tanacetum cinerariifolium]
FCPGLRLDGRRPGPHGRGGAVRGLFASAARFSIRHALRVLRAHHRRAGDSRLPVGPRVSVEPG